MGLYVNFTIFEHYKNIVSKKMKKTFVKIIFSLAIFSAIIACESQQTVNITVKDYSSKQPLDSVFVEFMAGDENDYTKSGTCGYTDSLGVFTGSFMIGCSFGCYDFYFECSKSGYQNYTSEFNVNEKTVFLESVD
jgi:hypothetical protein